MDMFCYQCEQTAKGTGCTVKGVCGKDAETAALQDLLVHVAKGVSQHAHRARGLGAANREADAFVIEALFTAVTNVNFDPERVAEVIRRGVAVRERARRAYENACASAGVGPEGASSADATGADDSTEELVRRGEQIGIRRRMESLGDDVTGLQELITYGLKGAAAYADHARILGFEDGALYGEFHDLLSYVADAPSDVEALTSAALRVGALNLKVMELLDTAHTSTFGKPSPTRVRVTPVAGKGIVVSGHDLKDLKQLLEQTRGRGVNVYTHGEMLPAHGYPELNRHAHLVGNYGGAWQEQRKEFDDFPGAILMTTNCIQKPRDGYAGRIFTTGLVAWPGVAHIHPGPDGRKDFSPVIDAALAEPGFDQDAEEHSITVGFGHDAVLAVADKVVEAVKAGRIRHFFLIGGCDGAKPGRNYYTDFARQVPHDCLILTLACGKYRFNKLDFGEVAGLPRLLDCGQCNDAYSAIRIASALADAFDCGVNDLPLSLVLSWFEQKAVAILLTLLHLGIRGIRIGPSLPAFVTPPVLKALVDRFGLKPVSTPEQDLAAALA